MRSKTRFLLFIVFSVGFSFPASGWQTRASVDVPITQLAAAFLDGGSAPADRATAGASAVLESRAQTLYRQGSDALDKHQWQTAVGKFNELASLHDDQADAALYWKAYAQNKLGQREEALATLSELEQSFPHSHWLKDARALQLEVRQASGQKVLPQDQPDEDLKLLAINALMNSDPERALPLLQKLLQSNQPEALKERALFVLTQSGSPAARQAVVQIARRNSDPELQKKALDDLALFGGADSRKMLADVYASSNDPAVKREILHGYMISGDRDRLLALAKAEKSPELRKDAIHELGIMGAQDMLWQLYTQEPSKQVKVEILHSMFIGGNTQRLIEVARTESDPDLRQAAVRSLGLMGGQRTDGALLSIYEGEKNNQVREAVLNALFIQGNVHELIQIARKETNPELKRAAVSKLALMKSKEATDYMLEILNH